MTKDVTFHFNDEGVVHLIDATEMVRGHEEEWLRAILLGRSSGISHLIQENRYFVEHRLMDNLVNACWDEKYNIVSMFRTIANLLRYASPQGNTLWVFKSMADQYDNFYSHLPPSWDTVRSMSAHVKYDQCDITRYVALLVQDNYRVGRVYEKICAVLDAKTTLQLEDFIREHHE